jgi:hypothetical protein
MSSCDDIYYKRENEVDERLVHYHIVCYGKIMIQKSENTYTTNFSSCMTHSCGQDCCLYGTILWYVWYHTRVNTDDVRIAMSENL